MLFLCFKFYALATKVIDKTSDPSGRGVDPCTGPDDGLFHDPYHLPVKLSENSP